MAIPIVYPNGGTKLSTGGSPSGTFSNADLFNNDEISMVE